jgi:hypothetical protein
MTEFKSDLISLNDVIKHHYFFNIPIYQRLYVWGKEQIHTLLNDIVQAHEDGKDEFYLGGALVIERDSPETIFGKETSQFDLIDGQQRFTTLWLISVVLEEALTEYRQVETEKGLRPRIGFAIRPQVTEFFQRLSRGEPASLPEARQLEDALDEIRSFTSNYEQVTKRSLDVVKLAEFIRNKVQLILTRVPKNTDLNKLFEVINNRGVQLQHHEILKAKLLEYLPKDKRECYGYLWDACSDMNGYVERSFRAVTNVNTVDLFTQNEAGVEHLAKAQYVIAELDKLQQNQTLDPLSLEEILKNPTPFKKDTQAFKDEAATGLPDRVTSIISFSMLLQHVLRIYLVKNNNGADIAKVTDKDLLNIFNLYWFKLSPSAVGVMSFIELLWEARYQFDKHVIKWVIVEEDKTHAIRRLYVNNSKDNSYLQRYSTDSAPEFALLQSMLYHSQQMTTQYWITPLLNYLLTGGETHAELYLQHLDNHLLCSAADAPLVERTRRFIENPWHKEPLSPASKSLNQQFDNGVEYPHYWFYKLEYILYLQMKAYSNLSHLTDGFRMTAKNSVEHIAPQTPENPKDKVGDEALHSFGNLALVTRSLNSEFSNKGYIIKQAEFRHRHHGKGVSLKLENIFENMHWTKNQIEAHQEQMIGNFDAYLRNVTEAVDGVLEGN